MGGRPGKIGQTRVPALELKLGMRDILPKPMINAAMGIINFGSSGFQMKPATSPIKVSVKPTSLQNSVRRMAPQAITYHYVGGSFTVKPDSSKSKNNPSTMMAAGDSKKGGLGGWVRGLFGGKGQTVSRDIAYTMYQYFLPTGEVNVYEMRFQGTDDVRVEVEYVSASGEKLPVPSNWQDFVVSRVVTHSSVKPPRFEGLKATRVDDVTDTSPMSRRSEWDEPRVRIPLTEIMTPETGKAAERTLGVSNDLGPIISINGKTYGIGQTLKVGRNQASANVVTPKDDPTVSSQHAEFSVGEGGAVMVRDLESTNGTYVNGMRLRSGGFRMLRDGDVVQMGNQQVLFFEQKNTPNPYDQKAYRAHRPLDVRRDPTNEYRMPTEAEMAKPKPEEVEALQRATQFVDTSKYMSRITLSSRGRDDREIVLGFSETVTLMGNGVSHEIMSRFRVDHWLKRDLQMMGVALQIGPDSKRPNARRLYVETGYEKIEVRKAHNGRMVRQSRPVERREDYTPIESSGILLENGDTVYADGQVLFRFHEPEY